MLLPFFFSLSLLFLFPDLPSASRHENEYLKLQLIHIPHSKSPSHILLLDHHRLSSLSLSPHRHRVSTPLISGASAGAGQYFAGISIGTPPQKLHLVVDTGSDLTWVTCSACRHDCPAHHPPGSAFLARHSSSFSNIRCSDPNCRLVPGLGCRVHNNSQNASRSRRLRKHYSCPYEYSYADGSTTSGLFSKETTALNSSSGRVVRVPGLKFGCGFRVSGPSVTPLALGGFEGASGVMGLGRGPISFTAQLSKRFGNKFSYCLMDYTLSPPPTSYLVIGGEGGNRNDVVAGSDTLHSTPLITNSLSPTFYYIGIKTVIISGESLPISSSLWALDDLGNGGTIIDSGTTLSFMPAPAYRAIFSTMKRRVKLPRVTTESTQGFDLCYNVSGVLKPRFPRMSFELVGDSVFDPPARNYFIDTEENVKCLALQAVNSPSGFAVIGNLMQQGFLFEFDNDNSRLFFSRNGCLHR